MKHIFTPLKVGSRVLKNRIVFGAHTTNMARNGLPFEQHIAYYKERARGGASMIVVEPMPVHAAAVLTRGNFLHSDDSVVPHFKALTQACKPFGTVMIQQLYHVGAHGDWDNSWHPNWSPSGGPSYHDNDGSHEMTPSEIEETIDGFVKAALRCQAAGFDGVEVWAAYHSLLDQFWTPFSNTRNDEWGGSLENRTRLSRTIMRRIREACGPDFIIGLSINDNEEVPVCLSRAEMVEVVSLHDAQGLMDYVTVGSGSYFEYYKILPTFQFAENLGADLAKLLKDAGVGAKVIAESNIRTPENANTVIGAGQSDLVSIVRGQIADPHLVKKAEEGRSDDIRGCLTCNEQCWGRRGRDYYISCLINPAVGHEYLWGDEEFSRTDTPRSVLVVGGGPAGLEAARVAAARGHRVCLVEASGTLGGQFRLAGMQPRRAQITDLIDWYERQLAKLGVDVRFHTYFDAEDIGSFGADHVIIATGSFANESGFQKALPHRATLEGIESGNVWSAADVMGKSARLGKRVVILDEGGHWKGVGTAWALAEAGHEVTIVTPDPVVAKELYRSGADVPARMTLAKLGVRFVTETALEAWTKDGASCLSLLTGEALFIPADSLVLATGNRSDQSLLVELTAKGITSHVIGDAMSPRKAPAAIREGRLAGLAL